MRLVTIGSQVPRPPFSTVVRHRRRGRAPALVAVALLSMSLASVEASASPLQAAADPKVISDWNTVAFDTIVVDAGKANAEAFMWFAFEQAAVYNAVVGITRHYELYRWNARGPRGASPQAAAAVAAHDVLLEYFPASQKRLDDALLASLAGIPDGPQKTQGMHYGERAADRLIKLRENDGRFAPITFDTPPAPGVWRPTPPAFAPFFDPWLARLRPLLLHSPSQFRPGPPPAMTSRTYTKDFKEVKEVGSATSTVRTQDQTDTALFIAGSTLPLVSSSLRDLAARHHLDISESARLFAAVAIERGRCRDHLLGFEVEVRLLAAGHRDPARRHRWESQHAPGFRLAPSDRNSAVPRLHQRSHDNHECNDTLPERNPRTRGRPHRREHHRGGGYPPLRIREPAESGCNRCPRLVRHPLPDRRRGR